MADFNQQSNDMDEKSLRTIFVRNISYAASVEDLKNIVQFQNAVEIKLPFDQDQGKTKGFGFVEFATPEDCQQALSAAQGIMVDNRELICQQSQPKSSAMQRNLAPRQPRAQQGNDGFQSQGGQFQGRQQGGFQRNGGQREDYNSLEKTQRTIFARNLSWNVTVANLYDIDHFSNATEIKIPTQRIDYVREANDPSNRKPRGFAFIEFATQEDCAVALAGAQGLMVDKREIICIQSQPKENQQQQSGGYQNRGGQSGGQHRGGQGQWNQNQGNGGGDFYGQQNNGGW